MRRMKKDKSPWADLDVEFKENVAGMTDEEISQRIAEVAMNEVENLAAKKADQDLKEKRDAAKFAGEQYSEATKMNRLRISFAHSILEARGKR